MPSNVPHCSATYGSTINPSDCSLALAIFQTNLQARTHAQIHPSLPIGSNYHTCAIGISWSTETSTTVTRYPASPPESIQNLVPTLVTLISTCVGSETTTMSSLGDGGVLRKHGLTFVVTNPMQVPVYGTCLASPEPSGMDLGQCIEWRQGLRSAWNTASYAQHEDDAAETGDESSNGETERPDDAPSPFGSDFESLSGSDNVSVTAWV